MTHKQKDEVIERLRKDSAYYANKYWAAESEIREVKEKLERIEAQRDILIRALGDAQAGFRVDPYSRCGDTSPSSRC